MREEVVFAGFGGQGILFIGQMLAYAAMDQGYKVTWFPSYGPEMRGGTAYCYVIISDKPISSPIVQHPKVVATFNTPSFDKFEPKVATGGYLIANSSLISRKSQRTDITKIDLPATELAHELGDVRVTNAVVLGTWLMLRPSLTLDEIKWSFGKHIPMRHRDMLPLNLEALSHGANFISQMLASAKPG
jgi:2-oxoglutarate ferredoxin oxidoreductase subunit gamma